jgi:hypothetical protein
MSDGEIWTVHKGYPHVDLEVEGTGYYERNGYAMSTRNKGHKGVYWFGHPESKTLHPVLSGVCIAVRESQEKI